MTQAKIGERIGWSENIVKRYCVLIDKIVPEVLEITKGIQNGRGTEKVPMGTFDFTERWFRDSGLYDLCEVYQKKLLDA